MKDSFGFALILLMQRLDASFWRFPSSQTRTKHCAFNCYQTWFPLAFNNWNALIVLPSPNNPNHNDSLPIGSCMSARLRRRMVLLEKNSVSRVSTRRAIVPTKSYCHEAPVSKSKEPRQWIERNVASWSLRVMVWAWLESSACVEGSAGNHRRRGRRANYCTRKHLARKHQQLINWCREKRTLKNWLSWDLVQMFVL